MLTVFKRVLSAVLVVTLLLGGAVPAFAAETADAAVNTATQQTYTDVAKALAEASAGDTIVLGDDASIGNLIVFAGVTLDLNGHSLEAEYVSCFGDLVDSRGAGLLKVAENRFLLQRNNSQLPVRSRDGYRFANVTKFNIVYQEEKSRYVFQPFIDAAVHDLLTSDAEDTGVTVNVRISWAQKDGMRSQNFVFNKDFVKQFLDSYNQTGDKYGKMLTLSVTGTANFKDVTFEALVCSDSGVEFASAPIIVNKTEEEKPVDKFVPKATAAELKESKTYQLGELFTAVEGAKINSASVAVTMTGDGVSMTYTPDAEDWTRGTVAFTGTGPISITITDGALCNPATLSDVQVLISWEGKKISVLGDSISAGVYVSSGGYTTTLAKLTGATIQNISKSGTLVAGEFITRVTSVAADADLVIVYGGTNDYWHKKTHIGAEDSTDTSTYVGALRYLWNYLRTNNPDAQVLFVFPSDQTFQGKPCTTDFGYGTLHDFRAAFLNFCTKNGVAYLDLGETEFDAAKHTSDGVHPNETGHQMIAQAICDRIARSLETSITVEREIRLLPNATKDLPESGLAASKGVSSSYSPFAYVDKNLFAGKHITKIGIPVKSVQALDDNQTFTLSVVKTTSDDYEYVSKNVLTLPREALGDLTTVNKWVYVDVDLQLAEDETLAFGMPDDTVSWGYLGNKVAGYAFRIANSTWSREDACSIFFDVYATETLTFRDTEKGFAAVTAGRAIPGMLADFPGSTIAGSDAVQPSSAPFCYVNQSLFAGKRITKIGIPVKSVQALDDNQTFTLSVVKTGSGAYQYVSQHTLTLPKEQLGTSTTVNKWVYVDMDLQLAEDETLAFGGKNDTVTWAWKSGYSNSAYQFRNVNGTVTKGIFFDVFAEQVLTHEEYLRQEQEEQERLEAEKEQERRDPELREKLADKGISILGDSISTYTGWSNNTSYNSTIGNNAIYYNGSRDGFTAVNETWWMQTIVRSGLDLVVNNSWSGDQVSNRGVSRSLQLHNNDGRNPDIIAVYLGINDFRNKVTAENFRVKYDEMISGMMAKYEGTDVYLFTLLYTTDVASGVNPADVVYFNEVIRDTAQKYNCTLVDIYTETGIIPENLSSFMGDGRLHPNYAGMDLITRSFMEALRANYLPE